MPLVGHGAAKVGEKRRGGVYRGWKICKNRVSCKTQAGRGSRLVGPLQNSVMKIRRRLCQSLACRNEYTKLELPRTWEPSGSSGPTPVGEG